MHISEPMWQLGIGRASDRLGGWGMGAASIWGFLESSWPGLWLLLAEITAGGATVLFYAGEVRATADLDPPQLFGA